jgi:hypothetical protein
VAKRSLAEPMPIPKTPLAILLLFCCLTLTRTSVAASEHFSPPQLHATVADQLISAGIQMENTAFDCSHFVNYVFEKAGLEYAYRPSRILYRGIDGFKRVSRPAAGDLIVWPGHVGIIVDPDEKTFLSVLRHGPRVTSYTSRYWRRRGHARFFRYNVSPTRAEFQAEGSADRDSTDSGMN